MPTTVTSSIGTASRTYATLQSWQDAAPANLVTECYKDSEFTATVNIGGSVVDSTRYKELTCATGQSFADHADAQTNPLRYDQSKGVSIRVTTGFTDCIVITENFVRISKLQIFRNNAGSSNRAIYNSGVSDQLVVQCVLVGDGIAAVGYSWTNGKWYSCLFIQRGASASSILRLGDAANEVINCTIACPTDVAASTDAIEGSFVNTAVVKNTIMVGATNCGPTSNFTYTNCYTDDNTSLPSGVTNIAYDTTTGTGFQNINDTTLDYRLKSTSGLINVGVTDSKGSPDIVGTIRPEGASYDVGAWEYKNLTVAVPTYNVSRPWLPSIIAMPGKRMRGLLNVRGWF
jgi:hypothetical protein